MLGIFASNRFLYLQLEFIILFQRIANEYYSVKF